MRTIKRRQGSTLRCQARLEVMEHHRPLLQPQRRKELIPNRVVKEKPSHEDASPGERRRKRCRRTRNNLEAYSQQRDYSSRFFPPLLLPPTFGVFLKLLEKKTQPLSEISQMGTTDGVSLPCSLPCLHGDAGPDPSPHSRKRKELIPSREKPSHEDASPGERRRKRCRRTRNNLEAYSQRRDCSSSSSSSPPSTTTHSVVTGDRGQEGQRGQTRLLLLLLLTVDQCP